MHVFVLRTSFNPIPAGEGEVEQIRLTYNYDQVYRNLERAQAAGQEFVNRVVDCWANRDGWPDVKIPTLEWSQLTGVLPSWISHPKVDGEGEWRFSLSVYEVKVL